MASLGINSFLSNSNFCMLINFMMKPNAVVNTCGLPYSLDSLLMGHVKRKKINTNSSLLYHSTVCTAFMYLNIIMNGGGAQFHGLYPLSL